MRRQIDFVSPEGKEYKLKEKTATLVVRPRGWHLVEKHVYVDGEPISASLFDFGLYFFHNAHELLRRGSGPYFYLPKLESHLEGPPLERGLQLRPGLPEDPPGHHPGHGPH